MRNILYAFFAESVVPTQGSTFYTTVRGARVRVTHVSYDTKLSEWSRNALPDDLVWVGEVWSDSCQYDPDHMDPNLSYGTEFLETLRATLLETT